MNSPQTLLWVILWTWGGVFGGTVLYCAVSSVIARHRTVYPFPPAVQPVVEDQLYDRVVEEEFQRIINTSYRNTP